MENDLKKLVNENEKILYEGKPNKKCFVFESIFNPMMPFAELSHVDLHRGIFDQMFNVGDIITTSSQFSSNNNNSSISICSISNYIDVYNLVKKLQKDIYTDVMYPNDKRPSENHGYNTEYKG